jgi:hypothetical protein
MLSVFEVVLANFLLLSVGCGGQALDAGSNPTTGDAGSGAGTQATRPKLIFMSSQRYSANLGGLDGADKKCQALAEAASRSGTFRAWLSTISMPASARLTHSSEPYVLVTGEVVANDWADLTRGTLRHAVDQTENLRLTPPDAVASCAPLAFWTSTDERGSQYGGDCMGWTMTSAEVAATLGVNSADFGEWSNFYDGSCDCSAPILCLEQ